VITVKVRIPELAIHYRPSLAEVLKEGWIQYLAFLVLVYVLLMPMYDFLIRRQVVKTIKQVEPRNVKSLKSAVLY
jgi:Transmembrane protein 231